LEKFAVSFKIKIVVPITAVGDVKTEKGGWLKH
jgi:hypothetical protein